MLECKDFADFIRAAYGSYIKDIAIVPWAGPNYFRSRDEGLIGLDDCALRISFKSLEVLSSYVQARAARHMNPERFDFRRNGVHYMIWMSALIIPEPSLPKEYVFKSYDYSVCDPNVVNKYVHNSADWNNIGSLHGSVNRGFVGLSCGIDVHFGEVNEYLKFLNYRKNRGLPLTFDVMTLSGVKYALPHRIEGISFVSGVNGATISN